MKKVLNILLLIIYFLSIKTAFAQEASAPLVTVFEKPLVANPRVRILKAYFAKYKSPLVENASDFVEAADYYGVDWRLLPSITGVESTFGKFTPGNEKYPSYNGWGWGVYGTQALYFKSWREGIFTVTQGLKENYINLGLDTPFKMNRKYAASPSWGGKVTYFMNDLERFSEEYLEKDINRLQVVDLNTRLATFTSSAILAI